MIPGHPIYTVEDRLAMPGVGQYCRLSDKPLGGKAGAEVRLLWTGDTISQVPSDQQKDFNHLPTNHEYARYDVPEAGEARIYLPTSLSAVEVARRLKAWPSAVRVPTFTHGMDR